MWGIGGVWRRRKFFLAPQPTSRFLHYSRNQFRLFFRAADQRFFFVSSSGKNGAFVFETHTHNVISRIFSEEYQVYNFLSVRYARKLSCGGGNESRHMYTPTTTVKKGSGVRFQKGERERERRKRREKESGNSLLLLLLPILSPFLALREREREREREQKSQKRRRRRMSPIDRGKEEEGGETWNTGSQCQWWKREEKKSCCSSSNCGGNARQPSSSSSSPPFS